MQEPKPRRDEADILIGGRRLHYLRAGCGPPLLLIHGLVGSLRNWRLNVRSLAEISTVYALDLLNMGESDRVIGLDPTLEATADRIVAFMDALGIEQADIAGHSHGGAVCLALAARHRSRIRRLILFAPANPFCDNGKQLISFYRHTVGAAFARRIPGLPRWTKAIALRRMFGTPARVPTDALDGYVDGLAIPGTIDHVLRILDCWDADMARLRSVLPTLANMPTLLVWGERDRAVSLGSARELGRVLRRSRLVVLPGVGHIPFEEVPSVCNGIMLEFLAAPPATGAMDPARPRSEPSSTRVGTRTLSSLSAR